MDKPTSEKDVIKTFDSERRIAWIKERVDLSIAQGDYVKFHFNELNAKIKELEAEAELWKNNYHQASKTSVERFHQLADLQSKLDKVREYCEEMTIRYLHYQDDEPIAAEKIKRIIGEIHESINVTTQSV